MSLFKLKDGKVLGNCIIQAKLLKSGGEFVSHGLHGVLLVPLWKFITNPAYLLGDIAIPLSNGKGHWD